MRNAVDALLVIGHMPHRCNYKSLHGTTAPPVIDMQAAISEPHAVARRTKELGPQLGRRAREARDSSGYPIRELAKLLGASPNTVHLIERGDGGNAGVGLLTDLARLLKVRPAWLVFGDGHKNENYSSLEEIRAAIAGLPKRDRDRLIADLCKPSE